MALQKIVKDLSGQTRPLRRVRGTPSIACKLIPIEESLTHQKSDEIWDVIKINRAVLVNIRRFFIHS